LPSIAADHMLVRLIRSPSLQIARRASDGAAPRCCKQPLRSFLLGHCAQPACSVKTSAVPDPPEIWPRDLKAQILQSATKIKFRYEVDSHKLHSDATLEQAEKAIGYDIFTCKNAELNTESMMLYTTTSLKYYLLLCTQVSVPEPTTATIGTDAHISIGAEQHSTSMV